jgi:protein-S-isoprenylcysteine O-methyltransferase Ste14
MNVTATAMGLVCALVGAVVITGYTILNARLRRRGASAAWLGGWIVGGIGMTLMGVGWGLLAAAGPHLSVPVLQYVGVAVSGAAGCVYLTAAAHVGRLRSRGRYSLDLHTEGIYRLVRHPQALALCILAVGVGLATLSRPYIATLPLWVAFWVAYAYFEERFELIPSYGDRYQRYMRTTSRLVPSFRSLRALASPRRRRPKADPNAP